MGLDTGQLRDFTDFEVKLIGNGSLHGHIRWWTV
jgi:hypothetical protein